MDLLKSLQYPNEIVALVKYNFCGGKESVLPKLDYVRLFTPVNIYITTSCICVCRIHSRPTCSGATSSCSKLAEALQQWYRRWTTISGGWIRLYEHYCILATHFHRPAICIFYLVLRALDTVEDDMTIPYSRKIPLLKQFYKHLYEPEWRFTQSKEKDKAVLEEFPKVKQKQGCAGLI